MAEATGFTVPFTIEAPSEAARNDLLKWVTGVLGCKAEKVHIGFTVRVTEVPVGDPETVSRLLTGFVIGWEKCRERVVFGKPY